MPTINKERRRANPGAHTFNVRFSLSGGSGGAVLAALGVFANLFNTKTAGASLAPTGAADPTLAAHMVRLFFSEVFWLTCTGAASVGVLWVMLWLTAGTGFRAAQAPEIRRNALLAFLAFAFVAVIVFLLNLADTGFPFLPRGAANVLSAVGGFVPGLIAELTRLNNRPYGMMLLAEFILAMLLWYVALVGGVLLLEPTLRGYAAPPGSGWLIRKLAS